MTPVQTAPRIHAASQLEQAFSKLADFLFAQAPETAAVGVTSIKTGAGATTIAQNLALASAHAAKHTLLIAPRPPFGEQIDGQLVLSDAATSDVEWAETMYPTSHAELFYALYSASGDQHPVDVKRLAAALELRFDRVLVDLPEIPSLMHHRLLLDLVGDVVVVAEPGTVLHNEVSAARESLDAMGIRNRGLILNRCS